MFKKTNTFLRYCLCLLFFSAGLQEKQSLAQTNSPGSPFIQQFSKAAYKAGTQNWDIAQDDRGFLYFANNDGLLSLEGSKWNTFPLPNFTIMRSIAIDKKGRIFTGGQDEVGIFERNPKGEWTYTSLVPKLPEEWKSFEDIWEIFITPTGTYLCSQKVIFLLEGEKISIIEPVERFDNFIREDDQIYVRDTRAGLLRLNGKNFVPVNGGTQFTGNHIIRAILPHPSGKKLILTLNGGLFLMDEEGITPFPVPLENFLKSYEIYCAVQLTNQNYAIGTTTNGLLIMDPSGKMVTHLNKQNGLQNNTILSVFEDREKNVWLGLDNGVDYIHLNSPFSLLGQASGIEGTGYAAVLHNGKLILGTNQGLFEREKLNTGDGPFKKIPGLNGQVWCLASFENQLLIGHHNGLFRYVNGQFEKTSPDLGVWKLIRLKNHPDYMLAGTYNGLSLYHFSREEKRWNFIRQLEGFDESARVFEEDHMGNIWVSHVYKGLYKIELNMPEGIIRSLRFYNSADGLPDDLRINVGKIREEVVFATPRGIYKYEETEARFVPHEAFSELIGNQTEVDRILEDKEKNIWFSTAEEFGLIHIDPFGLNQDINTLYFNYLKDNLVEKFEYVYTLESGESYIGAQSGFIHYSGKKETFAPGTFQTYLTNIRHLKAPDTLIYALVPNQMDYQPVFMPSENSFAFGFMAPSFENSDAIQYRYKLEGYEEEWSDWTLQTEKEYTNLPHGRYTFLAQAKNTYNQLSNVASWSFLIRTPWYASNVFKAAMTILGLIFLFVMHGYYTRKMEKEKKQLKIKQAQKMEEKEAAFRQEVKKSEAEIIKLKNEKLEADIRHKSKELASATMHLMQKAEMMNKLKDDLKKLQQSVVPENSRKIQQLVRNIEMDMQLDEEWEQFELHFDQVHENFLRRLREKFPDLTPKDQKLCAYLRMNLSTKEIAPLMKISIRGVEISRYRLRKKLDLDPDTNLIDFMMKL